MQTPKPKTRVLFLCTANSCRSQMAEGWTRRLKSDLIEPFSAGVEPKSLNPLAVQAMAEAGVDISSHRPKHVDELRHLCFDYVVTVCDNAHETCPVFPGATRIVHVGFDDPPALAKDSATADQAMTHYRRVRDQIRDWVRTLPQSLSDPPRDGGER